MQTLNRHAPPVRYGAGHWKLPCNSPPVPPPRPVIEPGMGTLEVFPLDTSEEFLYTLLHDVLENHWYEIQFGVLIQGSVLEISPPGRPTKFALFDGYLTVEFGQPERWWQSALKWIAGSRWLSQRWHWHMHLCIGTNTGAGCEPTPPEVAAHRLPKRCELYRKLNRQDEPTFWALRLFNGRDEQLMTIYLPNPLLTDGMRHASEPDWSRLRLWNHLRKTYLGLDPDPRDRLAKRFSHD